MTLTPQALRARKDIGAFEITWSDGTSFRLPFKFVRSECPCAECVHEITGERIIRPEWIPDDIQPTDLSFAGNYALKVIWSDGHASGIFTWERLQGLCANHQATAF